MRRPFVTPALAGAVAVAAGWLAGWVVRLRYASPNVDDYLYASLARAVGGALRSGDVGAAVSQLLHSGPFSPLLLAVSAPVAAFGPDVAVLVQLPVLLGLYAAAYLVLARRVPRGRAAVVAAALCLSPPALGWALMLHMALLSAFCALAAVELYLRSEGWSRARYAVACGVAVGLLALSRSLAPVYVAALVAALAWATLRRGERPAWRGVALATVAAGAVAGPWWAVSGPETARYLTRAGYDAGSGFVDRGNPVLGRAEQLGTEWGLALVVLLVAAVAVLVRRRAALAPDQRVLLVLAGGTLALLATSGNAGTAFALPAFAALVVAVPWPRVLAWGLVAVAVAGVTGAVLPALGLAPVVPPAAVYAAHADEALGGSGGARSGALHRDLVRRIGDGDVLVVRDDALVNVSGLEFEKQDQRRAGLVRAAPYDRGGALPDVPPGTRFVVAGTSCAPYHAPVDQDALGRALGAQGFTVAFTGRLSACNVVVLWARP